MKKSTIQILIFLIFITANSQVNFSTYGAVGDGISDDTSALQSALNSESNLVATPGSVFKVSGRLNINQGFKHIIEWSGSIITTTTVDLTFFNIDKRNSNGGLTVMRNLMIDGNHIGTRGVTANSRVELYNVDGKNYGQSEFATVSPTHIRTEFLTNNDSSHGDWIIDGCDADGLLGFGNECDYNDGVGASNAYLVYWRVIPTKKTTITFKNASIKNGYGPDGQNVGVFSTGLDVSNTLALTVFDNITSSGFERRGWKLFCGNLIIKNCTINNDIASNSTTGCVSAGLVAVGSGSGSTGASNIIFDNVVFQGPTTGGRDQRVIPINTHDIHFNNCQFLNGIDLAMTLLVDDVNVCSSSFGTGSIIYEYNLRQPYGTINLDADNTYVTPPNLTNTTMNFTNLICDEDPDPEPQPSKGRGINLNILLTQ